MKSKSKNEIGDLFKSKMNEHYRKIFGIAGLIFSTIFYFTQGAFGQIVQYAILKSDKTEGIKMSIFSGTVEMIAYVLGFFVLYAILGVTIFIVFGELFIRISEYFNIDSRLYRYMIKAKDVMTMDPVSYYNKHKDKIEENENRN